MSSARVCATSAFPQTGERLHGTVAPVSGARGLQVPANIDPELCAPVAAGLGLPAPEPMVPIDDIDPSPALSQLGDTSPPEGRVVGIVTDGTVDVQRSYATARWARPAW
ncbi:hypothetical protein OG448_06880 [Streptomyces sp. NBC_01171]|nr:hypothetical protein OG448_06880 [Streptomyces sp. NBC_01171]